MRAERRRDFAIAMKLGLAVKKVFRLLARFGTNLVEGLFRLFGFAKILIEL